MRAGALHIDTPVGIATAALALGVVVGDHLLFGNAISPLSALHYATIAAIALCAVAAIAFAWNTAYIRLHRCPRPPFTVLTFVAFTALGLARYALFAQSTSVSWPPGTTRLTAVVTESPHWRDGVATCRVQLLSAPHHAIILRISNISSDDVPQLGDFVSTEAHVTRPRNAGNPDEFDYARWLWGQGVSGTAFAEARMLRHHSPTPSELNTLPRATRLRLHALQLRQRLLGRYAAAGLGGHTLAVLAAMTLADRSLLTVDTRDLFAVTGASHLLALSGLHLGVLVGGLLWLLGGPLLLSHWRRPLCLVTVVAIWCFAFLTGLPASLLRACLMTTLLLIAINLERDYQPFNCLFLTIFVMLLVRPTYLFDVGAQLSIAAVTGILLIYNPLQYWLFGRWRYVVFHLKRFHLLWPVGIFLVSLSAQVFTLPLVAYYFHRIPLYAPLISVVLIPFTTIIIYGALLLLLTASLPIVSRAIAFTLTIAVGLLFGLMQLASSLPGASIPDFWSVKAREQVVVYNNRRCPALHLIVSPDSSWLLMPRPEAADSGLTYIRNSFWARRLTAEPVVLRDRNIVNTTDFRAVMLCQPFTKTSPRTSVDVLWLCDGFRGYATDLSQAYVPRLLVLDASLPRWLRTRLHSEADALGWASFDISEQGALKLDLSRP
ncbi:MAG: ComEC/Rec2 family competence protein [Actinomycetaceae bacterium]|nr:ComEC/Rec2 family competence protein [Actinomycetaceae bacterium]